MGDSDDTTSELGIDALSAFFDAWAFTDDGARLELVHRALEASASYLDPRTPAPLEGPEAIAAYVAEFARAAPGATATVVDRQDRLTMSRATVEFRMSDGATQLGQYFVEFNDAGEMTRLVGFVGTGTPA